MDAFIAYVIFKLATDTYKPSNDNSHKEVEATLITFSPCLNLKQARDIVTE